MTKGGDHLMVRKKILLFSQKFVFGGNYKILKQTPVNSYIVFKTFLKEYRQPQIRGP